MNEYRKKFIALDLETTHLDMREGRIMEVGAVETELTFDEKKQEVAVKFGRSFATLVNPEISASPLALTLTGITAEELSRAPAWREVKPQLQEFLGKEVILGHNIWFDLLYLKNQGLNLKNDYLDTLEITQTVLPLLASHSLEYLGQEFGVLDEGSHRALADAQSAGRVLGAALNEFLGYSSALQQEIKIGLAKSQLNFSHLFGDLPEGKRRKAILQRKSLEIGKAQKFDKNLADLPTDFPDKTLLSLPLGFSRQQDWLLKLQKEAKGLVVAVSHPMYLDLLPEKQKITNPAWALCEKRYEWLKSQETLPDEGLKILVKIAIFREISRSFDLAAVKWTQEERSLLPALLADPEVCPKHECGYFQDLKLRQTKAYFADLEGLFALLRDWPVRFPGFGAVFLDLGKIEDEFAQSLTRVENLRRIRERLRILYPIDELNISRRPRVPAEVEKMVNELDLFFGVLHLIYLKKENEFAEIITLDDQEVESERFQKLLPPAEKFLAKLRTFQAYLQSQAIGEEEENRLELLALLEEIKKLAGFFEETFGGRKSEKVYWFKFNARWVDIGRAPLELAGAWRGAAKKFETLTIVDTELPSLSWQYFQNRLGITGFAKKIVPAPDFSSAVRVNLFSRQQSLSDAADLVQKFSGKSIVVVPNESHLAELYELLRSGQVGQREILSYKFTGNLHAVKNRFRQARDAVLLVTTNVFLRSFLISPPADNLVVTRLPFEAPGRKPEARFGSPRNSFAEQVLPRAVHLLHVMLTRFLAAAPSAPVVYLLDQRILTDYDQAFLKYLQEFPSFDPVRIL